MTDEQENEDQEQQDVKVGDAIICETTINSLKVGKNEDVLSFTSLKPTEHETLSKLIEDGERVAVTIALPGEPDPNFPPMEAHATMVGYTINKNTDAPKFKGLKFSPGQHERISRLIESEEKVTLTIQQIQKQLFEEE